MRKKPPCYKYGRDCPKRKMFCHGFCNEFKAWKAEEAERKQIRDEIKEREYMSYSENAKKAQYKKIKEGRK